MDFNQLFARVKAILFTPKSEWPVIATEPATIKGLYLGYIMILAAIPAVFGFIKGSLIGYSAFGIHVRSGIGAGIGGMILGWILALIGVYVVALIINALANTFQGQPDQSQALKTIAYAYTASWIAGIAVIIPYIGWLIAIAGGIYSIYLLYLGLPHTMKCPPEKAAAYTVVTIIAAIIVSIIIGLIVAAVTGASMMGHSGANMTTSNGATSVTFDKDSTLGKLNAFSQRMDAASKKMDAAEKSGNAGAAFGAAMSALSGSNSPVKALSTDQIKAFAPSQLAGMQRTSVSASHGKALGVQTAEVEAHYAQDANHRLELTITDTGGASGLMGLAHLAPQSETESEHGFEKTYQQDGRLVHEKWNSQRKHGEFTTTIADRFTVEVEGYADSMDDLKRAAAGVDLAKLASLKDFGKTD